MIILVKYSMLGATYIMNHCSTSKYKKLLISKRGIGILKKLPKQGKDSESL